MLTLELPWPPSVNHYWRYGNGHFYISDEGRRYKLIVGGLIAAGQIRPLDGPVKITLDAFPPDRRRRDLDNLEKATLDACAVRRGFATGLYRDDCQIKRKESTMHDFDPERAGRVVVSVSPWPGAEAAGIPVPAVRPLPALPKARARRPSPDPVLVAGETPWPSNAQRSPSLLATLISRIKAIRRWRRSGAWLNSCAPI